MKSTLNARQENIPSRAPASPSPIIPIPRQDSRLLILHRRIHFPLPAPAPHFPLNNLFLKERKHILRHRPLDASVHRLKCPQPDFNKFFSKHPTTMLAGYETVERHIAAHRKLACSPKVRFRLIGHHLFGRSTGQTLVADHPILALRNTGENEVRFDEGARLAVKAQHSLGAFGCKIVSADMFVQHSTHSQACWYAPPVEEAVPARRSSMLKFTSTSQRKTITITRWGHRILTYRSCASNSDGCNNHSPAAAMSAADGF